MAMLSTADNPYDPYTQYDEWYAWDLSHGYNTPSYLARMVINSNDLSDADQALAINLAIDEIVSENVSGNYIKVEKKKEIEK
jgi:hypothetical protein